MRTVNEIPKTYKAMNITQIANKYGYSTATFWKLVSTIHLHDMVFLGYRPNDYTLNPMLVQYITEVIINQRSRTDVFEILKTNFFVFENK